MVKQIKPIQIYFVLAIVLLSSCTGVDKSRMRLTTGWEFALSDSSTNTLTSNGLSFKPVQKISDLTAVDSVGGFVILRNKFDLADTFPISNIALMLGRIVKADITFLNGSYIGSTGNFPPEKTNPWNINRLYSIPNELLRKKDNELLVKIYFEPGRGGIFDDPILGNRRYLENVSKLRTFYYVDTYKISAVISFLASVIFLPILFKRSVEKKLIYYTVAIFSFAIWSTYHFIWSLPFLSEYSFFDSVLFQKVLWIALFMFSFFTALFLYEFLERHKYKMQLVIVKVLMFVTAASIILAWSQQSLELIRKLAFLGSLVLLIFTTQWTISAMRDKVLYAKSIFVVYLIFTLLSITDVLIDIFNLYLPYFSPIAIPLYLTGLGLIIINQYIDANNEIVELSQTLDQKNSEIESKNLDLTKLDKLKDQFLANTSHELRTPLNGIIGLAESLMEGATGKLKKATVNNLDMIVSSGKRLSSLIGDILDFSQIKNDKFTLYKSSVYVNKIVDQVIFLTKPLWIIKPIQVINDIDKHIPPVYGDDHRIEQIMFNLIGNAIKFTNKGEIKIDATVKGEMIEITITDTGIGIPDDKINDIFNSFEQVELSANDRHYQGTGLGLSITKKIIELHGGQIKATSAIDVGSVFSFTLPIGSVDTVANKQSERVMPKIKIEKEEEDEEELVITIPTATGKKHTVLVVDDEPINIQVLTNYLSLNDYLVKTAMSGEEALSIIKNEGEPNLIILDVMMPNMSGFETCIKIRADYPLSNVPVILLTAKDRISDLTEGFNAGANDYLIKPFSKRELLSRIKTHLSLALINKSYSRFVPNEFLQLLNKESIIDIKLGDQKQYEMTVMFSDIRNFTGLSEQMSPKENFDFLNGYLKKIGPIIRSHNGFIDKYIGDAIMALFPGGPDDAVKAAVDIKKYLAIYNEKRTSTGFPQISSGFGIHTGSMILGTIGEMERMESTVISDAVNLGSRLEGLTKHYGVSILLSESAYEKLSTCTAYHYRRIDKVRVKGKEKLVTVYEIFDGDNKSVFTTKQEINPLFENALYTYESKKLKEAGALFKQILEKFPEDIPSQIYLNRCIKHEDDDSFSVDDHVENMSHK
ncbi:MAG: hypothetical protein RL596_985 [Bacteroidota bacterium]